MGKAGLQRKINVIKQKKCLRGSKFCFLFWCIRSNRVGKLCRTLAKYYNPSRTRARANNYARTHARFMYIFSNFAK